MTEMPSYLVENPSFEPYKPQEQYPRKGIPLISIILSIFTYILIFCVFKVSPSSVFNDTKFLFFISNTLILIIAADYGAFTDKEKRDLYDEYANIKRSPVFVQVYQENPRSKIDDYAMVSAEAIENHAEEADAKDVKKVPSHEEVHEKILTVVSENVPKNVTIYYNVRRTDAEEKTCDARHGVNPKPYGRSKSEKERGKRIKRDARERRYDRSESDSSKWMIVHEKSVEEERMMDQKWENVLEESEEFSKMSNEELNRRVEEFIQRFNKQMKLQALGNREILS
ncbi:PREDICTED: uncharacterized protein LOC104814307 [Tarenaya hassleriana]|uniref:uncharacterized protein LOC104814307 n=1 Tax=Tarenaya hassleriana TaxID=28532 RepID=UPI00053C6C31|nr:PREDICTED: uncharacterized protein LOC104814307 [Tarenaya hassleriana]